MLYLLGEQNKANVILMKSLQYILKCVHSGIEETKAQRC